MTGECQEAILLVGGQGTRLRPLTLRTPKPMLPTAGVPFLAHSLARLRACGVRRVVLATGYQAEAFTRHFDPDRNGRSSAFGLELVFATEGEPLGTSGGVRNAVDHLSADADGPVLVLNGDVLSGHDLGAQLATHDTHAASKPAATLHLTEVGDPRSFGCVRTGTSGHITAFQEKSPDPSTRWINAGTYVFDRRVLARIPPGYGSLEHDVFPGLLDRGELLLGYPDSAYWLDVGTPGAYVRACRDVVLGRLETPAILPQPQLPGPALVADTAKVASDASVDGGSTVGESSLIGPGVAVSGSVLFDEVTVAEGAVVRDSALAKGAWVGAGAIVDGVVAGEGVVIGPYNELRRGMRVWPDVELPPGAIRFSSDL